MKLLRLALLSSLLFAAPVSAKEGPGVSVEVLRSLSDRAQILVTNSGRKRANFHVNVLTQEGVPVPTATISPSSFTLSRSRQRRVRILNLPTNTPVLLCATVEVSPTLDLQSCASPEVR